MKKIKLDIEDIEINPSVHEMVMECFKQRDELVINQISKAVNVSYATVRGELNRMLSDGVIKMTRRSVRMEGMTQCRSMSVYSLVDKNAR